MCMGSAPRATITMPDTRAYDRMLDQQLSLMNTRGQQDMLLQQERLNQAVRNQQNAMQALNTAATQRANDTTANAQRIAALIGTPPPEPTAKAPTLASNRSGRQQARGKAELRINRQGVSASPGTSLNIGY